MDLLTFWKIIIFPRDLFRVIEETAFKYCSRCRSTGGTSGLLPGSFEVRDILRGLRACILEDLKTDTAQMELLVLGLIGKHLTGPWMQMFYTSADNKINHVQAIEVVKQVVVLMKKVDENPLQLLTSGTDMFGRQFSADPTLDKLRKLGSGSRPKQITGHVESQSLRCPSGLGKTIQEIFRQGFD